MNKQKEKSYFCTKCLKEHKISKNSIDLLYEFHRIYKLTAKYWCSKCQRYHYRGKIYLEHREYLSNLTSKEIWILQFNKSCRHYSQESHKLTYGSKKQ